MKKGTLLFLIFLMIAMAGALVLLNQNQDTRKGATFANTSLFILPSDKINGNINETISAQVWFETQSGAKVDGVQTKVCYGKELSLAESGVVVNTVAGFEDSPIFAVGETSATQSCSIIVVTSKKAAADLVTTAKAMTLNFTAVSVGSGSITINKDASMVTGDNSASPTDKTLAITSVAGTTYTIGTLSTGCNLTVNPPRLCPTGYYCKTISELQGADGVCTEGCDTNADCPSGQVCSNHVCTIVTTDVPILNYKVSFAYVKAGDNKCLVNWPLQVIVMGGGESKVYTNVIPSSKTEANGKVIFQGSLPLVGFNHLTNVAVFIKGPKHLQRKYAVQSQSGPYSKAGGELTLTKLETTSPVYDFSAYPMLAGDVIGANSESQDGWISGVDYSFIKTKADLHQTVAEGTYLKGDLDGNCQVNANDVNELKISLEKKQEELY